MSWAHNLLITQDSFNYLEIPRGIQMIQVGKGCPKGAVDIISEMR